MPTTKDRPPLTTLNGVAAGYYPGARARYHWVAFEETEGPEGGEPFRAEIRSNLTWGEVDELRASNLFVDIFPRLAPYVRAWNLLGLNVETGELEAVPAPADAGPEAFKAMDAELCTWLWLKVCTAHLGDEERGKD